METSRQQQDTKIYLLSLFQLKTAAKQTKTVKYLHLGGPGREPKPGTSCLVAGWGQTKEAVQKISDVLMSVNVTVVDRKKCSKSYNQKPVITKEMICAGSENVDACKVRFVQQVSSKVPSLPQLCLCETTCISVHCRATQEGRSCAKGQWWG